MFRQTDFFNKSIKITILANIYPYYKWLSKEVKK